MKRYKITIHVPNEDAEALRQALGKAGAGQIGNYSHCSFSYHGTGRFMPDAHATPHIGQNGILQNVEEESIEIMVSEDIMTKVVRAIYDTHPYEEPAVEIVELLNAQDWL